MCNKLVQRINLLYNEKKDNEAIEYCNMALDIHFFVLHHQSHKGGERHALKYIIIEIPAANKKQTNLQSSVFFVP